MKFYVKRSDLLHFHRNFYDSSTELNVIHLILTPLDFIFLTRIICSFFTKEISLHIQNDIRSDIKTSFYLSHIDKDILKSAIDTLSQQAILAKDGTIAVHLMNSLHISKAFEVLLSSSVMSNFSFESEQEVILKKLSYIERRLGYINHNQESLTKILSPLCSGDLVRVGDDSGATFVKVVCEVAPYIYIVTVEKTKITHQGRFPHGKKYAAVLLSTLLPAQTGQSTAVCLFEYYDGITQPLFKKVVSNNVFFLEDSLDYRLVINNCSFKK